jgi:hypothetical protein
MKLSVIAETPLAVHLAPVEVGSTTEFAGLPQWLIRPLTAGSFVGCASKAQIVVGVGSMIEAVAHAITSLVARSFAAFIRSRL